MSDFGKSDTGGEYSNDRTASILARKSNQLNSARDDGNVINQSLDIHRESRKLGDKFNLETSQRDLHVTLRHSSPLQESVPPSSPSSSNT
ncbi:unnamed protein product, partial [Trichobilharzia regenti]